MSSSSRGTPREDRRAPSHFGEGVRVSWRKLRLPSPILAALFLAGPLTFAQERRDTIYALPAVTVTAARTSEDILRVPLAVSRVAPASFEHTRYAGLDQALRFVPGVLVQSRSGSQDVRLTVRGFGARGNGDRSNAGTIRGIRVQVDGFPLSEPDGRTSLDLVDLWSITTLEIVRSNTSALYGGASGGLVDIHTVGEVSETGGKAGLLIGPSGLRTVMAMAETPVGTGGFRASARGESFEGWRKHSQESKGSLNLSLNAAVGPAGRLGVFLAAASNLMRIPGPLTREQLEKDPSQSDSTYDARDERRFHRIARLGARWDQEVSEGHQISVRAFVEPKILQRSERNRFRNFTRYHLGGGGMYRLFANLSRNIRLRTLAGVDEAYQDGAILFYSLSGGNRGPSLLANKQEGGNSLGFFLQEELEIARRLTVTVGGRYDVLTYSSDDFLTPSLAATKEFSAFTPAVGVSFLLGPSHSIYVSAGGGLEAPAFNEIDPPPPFDTRTSLNPFLEPMLSRTVEAGIKGVAEIRFIGPSLLRYEIALYTLTVKNEIVPYDGGAYFLSAGRSRRSGIEAAVSLESPVGLSGGCAVTVSRNRYVDYRNELGNFAENSIAGLPGAYASAFLRYRSSPGIFAEASMITVGGYFADDANSDEARVEACTTLDVTIGGSFTLLSTAFEAYLTAANVADTRYVASAFINGVRAPNTSAPRYFEPGLPRNILAGLKLKLPP